MTKKKTGGRPRKSRKRTPKKKKSLKYSFKRIALGIGLLILLVASGGVLAYYLLEPHSMGSVAARPSSQVTRSSSQATRSPSPASQPSSQATPEPRVTPNPAVATPRSMSPERTASPTFEVYPKHEILIKKPLDRPPENLSTGLPRVAIIIDDMGYDRAMAEKFLSLEVPLTFSLFPHGPHREYIVRRAHERGLDVMLHLPMEPVEYPSVNPGPGALLTGMSPDQLILQLKRNLDTIPTLVGVNNHMGSRMTTVSTQMYQIFTILKQRELFFIDSLTTAQSVCKPSARLLQVPFAQRDVFLDHRPESEFVRGQIRLLTRIARSHGEAIGIGHPHEVTYRILRDILPRLQREVHLVPAADLVRPTG